MKHFLDDLLREQSPATQIEFDRAHRAMKYALKVDRDTCLAYLENAQDQGLELPLSWESLPDQDLLKLTALTWTLRSKRLGVHSLQVESLPMYA